MGGGTSILLGKPLPSTIEKRMTEALKERIQSGHLAHKTFQSIILKFPKIDESFQAVETVFKKFDRGGNGVMHLKELKSCLGELHVDITDKELKEFYAESDFDHDQGIDFKEFIVFLALIYFLAAPSEDSFKGEVPSRLGLPQLEASFETIVEAFASLDTNGDGYLSKQELIESMNESSSGRITDRTGVTRFEEMDWDKNGLVTFKEFIFSFIDWVRIEEEDDSDYEDDGGSSSKIHSTGDTYFAVLMGRASFTNPLILTGLSSETQSVTLAEVSMSVQLFAGTPNVHKCRGKSSANLEPRTLTTHLSLSLC